MASVLQLAAPQRILLGSDFPALFEEDVQPLIQALADNPLLQPGDLEMIQRSNALQLFPGCGALARRPADRPAWSCVRAFRLLCQGSFM